MVDQLFVSDPDGSSQNFALTGETITIGRTAVNDIVLPLDTISSRHARLNRTPGGWQITDLGSTNGTFLDGKKLAPNVPQMWEPGVELRLEPLILTWEAAESRMPTPLPVAEEVLDPPTQTLETTGSGGVSNLNSIKIEPMSVVLAPGELKPIEVSAVNQAHHVEQYFIDLEGLPEKWVEFTEERAKEMPNYQETRFRFTIKVPNEGAPAQTYPYRVVLRSVSDRRDEGNAFGNILVKPEPRYQASLNPRKLKNGGTIQLVINNQGNVDLDFVISGQEEDDPVQFSPSSTKVLVPAGQEERIEIKVKAAQRHLTGRVKQSPYEFQLEPDKGDTRFVKGELEVFPRIPQRVFLFLVVLLGLPTVIGVSFLRQGISVAKGLAADATAEQIAAITETATADVAITEAIALSASEATATADFRATGAWLTLDTDQDGLTNGEEIELGTDHTDHDMDNDGLLDGEEIRPNGVAPYQTNVNLFDTDSDGLSDWEEVNGNPNAIGEAQDQFTLPYTSDTDNDGIPDNLDADSEAPPTPTPIPEMNLLENPSFESFFEPFREQSGAFTKQELMVPDSWFLMVDDNVPNIIDGDNFVFPEMGLVTMDQLSECVGGRMETICEIFSGEQALKVFKDGLPIRFALFTDISLAPGEYRFRIHFFADAVAAEIGNQKQFAGPESAQIQLCVVGGEYPHLDWEPVEVGIVSSREVTFFVPEQRRVLIYVKFQNIHTISNNGWFLDDWNLQQTGVFQEERVGEYSDDHGCTADLTRAYSNR